MAQSVTDADVQGYIQTFTQRPRPASQPRPNQRLLTASTPATIADFIGKWTTPSGFVAIYPSNAGERACLIVQSKRTTAYAEGKVQGSVLRTETPLFLDNSENFLSYAAGDVLVPVSFQGNTYLGWGVYNERQHKPQFLTLGFSESPSSPDAFVTGKSANAIRAQFLAAGCQPSFNDRAAPGSSVQTIDGVTMQLSPKSTLGEQVREFQVQIQNNTPKAFSFYPNRVVAYDASNHRIPVRFSSLIHGVLVQPGGSLSGTIVVFGNAPQRVEIPEATTSLRVFKLNLPR